MSTRASYPPGVPCMVGVICPDDAEPAKAFYSALFGWDFDNIAGDDDPPFYVATLYGDRVASVAGSGNGEPGVWITAISVADREAAAQTVRDAGGSAPAGDTTEIPSIGRFHRVHDPAGAEVHLVQIDGSVAQRVDEPGAWSMSHLHVPDPGAVSSFYEAVFGWQAEAARDITLFKLPEYVGGDPGQPMARTVVAVASPDAPEPLWRPDFWVSDVRVAVRAAVDRGGQVVAGPTEQGDRRLTALLADPGGAHFTVSEPWVQGGSA